MFQFVLASMLVLSVGAFAQESKPEYCKNSKYGADRLPAECRDGGAVAPVNTRMPGEPQGAPESVEVTFADGSVGSIPDYCLAGYWAEDTLPAECRGEGGLGIIVTDPLPVDGGSDWLPVNGDGGGGFPELPPNLY